MPLIYRVQHYIYGDMQGGSEDRVRPLMDFASASAAQDFLALQDPQSSWEDYELVQILQRKSCQPGQKALDS